MVRPRSTKGINLKASNLYESDRILLPEQGLVRAIAPQLPQTPNSLPALSKDLVKLTTAQDLTKVIL